MKRIAILTPYLIPAEMRSKTVNLGDGFILRGIERLLGPVDPQLLFSPRMEPSERAQEAMGTSSAVVLGGANQLNDNYRVWPGMTAEKLTRSPFVFVPMGVGIHGEPGKTRGMSAETRAILEVIHERVEFSSWRCPRTIAYLQSHLPGLADRFLMTGCPVAYDKPVLEGTAFNAGARVIAVTATERGDFWERDAAVLEFVAKEFPRARKIIVVHQNFKPPEFLERFRHRLTSPPPDEDPVIRFRRTARKLGYSIAFPARADEAIRMYKSVDMHFGSRLHAHLHMLSQNKRSFLTAVDDRARGMAEAFNFPLLDPNSLGQWTSVDFEASRLAIRGAFTVMERFARSLA